MLTITDDASRSDLAEAITHLRARQRAAVIPSTAAELGEDIDALLDSWASATE